MHRAGFGHERRGRVAGQDKGARLEHGADEFGPRIFVSNSQQVGARSETPLTDGVATGASDVLSLEDCLSVRSVAGHRCGKCPIRLHRRGRLYLYQGGNSEHPYDEAHGE